ncbi:MAG TPA: glycosyltransferase family 39 protein [Candidatus Eisenbacteria bacterium]|nr:glycosyltransferase family 39 protein [Candidatus Eisenbacteria bacterium]
MQRADPARRSIRLERPRDAGAWLALFAVGLVLRVAYTWFATGPGATPSSDPATYDTVAWNLARGAGFSLDAAAGPYPTAFVPPVVPWLTSLLYRVVGHDYFAAVLLQCVIGALVPLLVASLAGSLFGGTVGRVAGWIAAVHPLLVFFSGYLLTETAFCAALLLALLLSAEWVRTPRGGRALGAGIAWGLATLTRPTALLLPLVIAAWGWRPLGLTVGAGTRLRHLALLALGAAVVVVPWTIRNATALRAFVPVTTGSGGALMVANNPAAWDDPAMRGGAHSGSYQAAIASEFRGLSEVEVDARARARAWSFMRSRVRDWPAVALAKIGRFWRIRAEGGGTGSWQRTGSPLEPLRRLDPLLVWSIVTLPFALWGVVRTLRGPRRWFQSLPLLVILYFMLLAVVFFGSLRMRMPIEPLVAMLAALGVDDARRALQARARGLSVVPRSRER